jgi:hypothetical protein
MSYVVEVFGIKTLNLAQEHKTKTESLHLFDIL